jgi:hypothetical protein
LLLFTKYYGDLVEDKIDGAYSSHWKVRIHTKLQYRNLKRQLGDIDLGRRLILK